MLDGAEARRQLGELERVVEFLEQLNLLGRTFVPPNVIAILMAMGLETTVGLVPTTLLPRILDRQRLLRRRLAIARRINLPGKELRTAVQEVGSTRSSTRNIDIEGRAREVLGYPHRGSVSPSRSV